MLEHGGNLKQAAQEYGIPIESWLDLSTGINPSHYPIPNIPMNVWQRLPEVNDGLIEAACFYYGCQSLLPTAGSQAALQVLPKLRPPCRIAMPELMYQEHARAWQNSGHIITFFDAFPDESTLNKSDVLLLCNPNNPTGKRYKKQQLLKWHYQLQLRGAWLIVDEAFMDMTPEESLATHSHLEGIFVLRSIGKFFGLAGIRIGFLLANRTMLSIVHEIIGPWAISGPSQLIAKHALLDSVWQTKMRQTLGSSSQKLTTLLAAHGLSPLGGTDLFQLITARNATDIHHALAKQGVWTRLFEDIAAIRFGLPATTHWRQLEAALLTLR